MRPFASVVGHALDAMGAALVLEPRPGVLALHDEDDLVEAALLGVRLLHDLDLPASALGVAEVHVEEVAGEEVGLLAALGAADLDDDVAAVVGILGKQQRLELFLDGEDRARWRPRAHAGARHALRARPPRAARWRWRRRLSPPSGAGRHQRSPRAPCGASTARAASSGSEETSGDESRASTSVNSASMESSRSSSTAAQPLADRGRRWAAQDLADLVLRLP